MGCFMSLLGGREQIKATTKAGGKGKSGNINTSSEGRGNNRRKNVVKKSKTASTPLKSTWGSEQGKTLIAYVIPVYTFLGALKPNKWDSCRVVGRTGSGLSQFIHDVTGTYEHGVAPDASLQPYTGDFKAVEGVLKGPYGRRNVTFIDTPGFDYSRGNDEHTTLKRLADWLRRRYGSKVQLDGVIYMHNIWNEEIYHRSKFLSSKDLERLCGSLWRQKIILVNSHWSEGLGDDGEMRERQLREGYWSFMLKKGSTMMRYESPGDHTRAREILERLLPS